MKDIINSIKVHLYERSTSPLFGAFTLSWLGWNYKFVLVLFSDLKVQEKFKYIETCLYPTILEKVVLGLFFPLLSAVIFILIYPYPARLIFSYWKKQQKQLNEVRQKIEDETLLSKEDSLKVKRSIHELETKHNEELDDRNNRITFLQESLESEADLHNKELLDIAEKNSQENEQINENHQNEILSFGDKITRLEAKLESKKTNLVDTNISRLPNSEKGEIKHYVLFVASKDGKGFEGNSLKQILESGGMILNSDDYYFYNKAGMTPFQIASDHSPWTLTYEDIHDKKILGLSITLKIRLENSSDAVIKSIAKLKKLAKDLDGILQNSKHKTFTKKDEQELLSEK